MNTERCRNNAQGIPIYYKKNSSNPVPKTHRHNPVYISVMIFLRLFLPMRFNPFAQWIYSK